MQPLAIKMTQPENKNDNLESIQATRRHAFTLDPLCCAHGDYRVS